MVWLELGINGFQNSRPQMSQIDADGENSRTQSVALSAQSFTGSATDQSIVGILISCSLFSSDLRQSALSYLRTDVRSDDSVARDLGLVRIILQTSGPQMTEIDADGENSAIQSPGVSS
jgi:hypothetical protein